MKIYTRGGDQGETALFGGQRVRKDTLRVEAFGTLDELNATLGEVLGQLEAPELTEALREIQISLFDLGSELATPPSKRTRATPGVEEAEVSHLESWIDRLDALLPPLTNFILPGGTPAATSLHLARAVCRRAERRVISLEEKESVSPVALRYLNRLSDLLFVMARTANHQAGIREPTWVGRERRKKQG